MQRVPSGHHGERLPPAGPDLLARLRGPLCWQVLELAFRTVGLWCLCRALDPARLAPLLLWSAWASLASVLIGVGGPSFLAIAVARQPASARSLFRRLVGVRMILWLAAIVALVSIAIATGVPWCYPLLFGSILLVGGTGPIGGGCQGVLMPHGVLDANGAMGRGTQQQFLGAVVNCLGFASLLVWPGALPDAWLPAITLLGGAVTLTLAMRTVRQIFADSATAIAPTNSPTPLPTLLTAALPLWLYGVLGLVQGQADLLLLQGHATAQELGSYGFAVRLLAVLMLPIATLGRLLAPMLAAPARDDQERLERLRPWCRRATFVLVPTGIGLALGGSDLILGLLGPKWTSAGPMLRVLCLELCVLALFLQSSLFVTIERGKGWFVAGLATAAASSLLLNLCWIPTLGAHGCALAHVLSATLGQLVNAYGYWRVTAPVRLRHRVAT